MTYIPRLKQEYRERVTATLEEEFGYKSVMQVPELEKIVVSHGVGSAVADKKQVDYAIGEPTEITEQKIATTYSKKGVASFKLRKGMTADAKVTLRGKRMYEFLDHLIITALPRVGDFQGIKATGFDGRGNYSLRITGQTIFLEIGIDKTNKITGMDITFVTSAYTNKEAKSLLGELGLPLKKS